MEEAVRDAQIRGCDATHLLQTNYFACAAVKQSWRTARQRFLVLLNPPGALYVYESERHFYQGARPLMTAKTSRMMIGAIVCTHAEGKDTYSLAIAGTVQLELRSESEEELQRLRTKLEEFQNIDYTAAQTEVIVEVSDEPRLVRDVKQMLTEPQADSIELELKQKERPQSTEA